MARTYKEKLLESGVGNYAAELLDEPGLHGSSIVTSKINPITGVDELTTGGVSVQTSMLSEKLKGSELYTPANDTISSEADAAAFLQKATLGPTIAEIQGLVALKSKRAWVSAEFKKTLAKRYMDVGFTELGATNLNDFTYSTQTNIVIPTVLIQSSAALRTKATVALCRQFVVSFPGGAFDDQGRFFSWVSWYDRMNKYVFGNWRDMIESITYSVHMSHMLSYYANEKAQGQRQPDENYARELLQLFTIGLWEMNKDGSFKLKPNGDRIPTYVNDDIQQIARCITGLTRWDFNLGTERYNLDNTTSANKARSGFGSANGVGLFGDPDKRLIHYTPFYEYGAKRALNGLVDIPEGTDPVKNLTMLHDALFNHPNAAPFFAKRMICHLVTSNPSPDYVARVSAAFEDNGAGVRGDMKAIWMAILTDPDASSDGRFDPIHGRVKDGFELWANQVRSLNRVNNTGRVSLGRDNSTGTFGNDFGPTAPRMQPSIFSAYDPTHQPSELVARGIYSPEMMMWSDSQIMRSANELLAIQNAGEPSDTAGANTSISIYNMLPLTGAAADMVERLNILLCGGKMSNGLRSSLTGIIGPMPIATATEQNNRVVVALQIISNSTDYWVQL